MTFIGYDGDFYQDENSKASALTTPAVRHVSAAYVERLMLRDF